MNTDETFELECLTLKSNFQGSIRGSKCEFVRLKYRIDDVMDVAIFNYWSSAKSIAAN